MKPIFKTVLPFLLSVVLMSLACTSIMKAQESVTEPPLPIYVVCPYHEDSLKAAFENSSAASGLSLSFAMKKYDSLQLQVQRSSAESTAHFTWLYALIALLGTMNIVLLFSTSQIRKELAQIKRFEHQQKLTPAELPVESVLPPESQKVLANLKSTEAQIPVRKRKLIAKKPRK